MKEGEGETSAQMARQETGAGGSKEVVQEATKRASRTEERREPPPEGSDLERNRADSREHEEGDVGLEAQFRENRARHASISARHSHESVRLQESVIRSEWATSDPLRALVATEKEKAELKTQINGRGEREGSKREALAKSGQQKTNKPQKEVQEGGKQKEEVAKKPGNETARQAAEGQGKEKDQEKGKSQGKEKGQGKERGWEKVS